MLLLRNNDIKNKGIAQIIAVAVLSLIVLMGIEGAIYNNPHVSAVDNNNISYTMEFIENTVGNMPDNVLDGLTAGASSLIPSSNPIRSGFKFAGWCDQATTKNGDYDICATGHSYQPGDTISLNQTGANNIKLYAIWTEPITFNKAYAAAGKSQSSGYYVMQDATSGICSAIDTGEIGEVKDSRDGTVYHIGKLADGNCWLLDNLALDLTDSTVLSGMTQDNTNASNTTLGYLKGTTSRNPSTDANGKYATAGVSNWTSSYSYSAPLVNMTNKDVIPTDATSTAGGYKVGGYYNYCAASAGSYCYGNGTDYGTSPGNATEDICPKGWRMPGGSNTVNLTATPPTGEYQNLYNNSSYNTYANYRSALRLPLSGYFSKGSADGQGSGGGLWWSSTRNDNRGMYRLYADTSSIDPANSYSRHSGHSVRCVLGS